MALIKPVVAYAGLVTFGDAYHKISKCSAFNKLDDNFIKTSACVVTVTTYVDQVGRDMGVPDTIIKERQFVITDTQVIADVLQITNITDAAQLLYPHIKALPEFAGSVDV